MAEVRFDDSFFGATVGFLPSFVGVSMVLFPAIGIGNALLGSPLADATVRLLVGLLLAVGIAALDLQFAGANPVPQAVLAAASYVAAFLFVRRRNR
ncbi:hypothetical protein [Haladaptatus salinisoli]|uniref:hypothetical protein n=1 Tax=Haladaptatus salinisoli TaxID=2884876 RepID=UPI001D0A5F13|nr:hypothetical protein [Haladaptatus salinisoli]